MIGVVNADDIIRRKFMDRNDSVMVFVFHLVDVNYLKFGFLV